MSASTIDAITTKDGVTIFYKDWGSGQPIVFSHGWPLSADDWDAQLMFFVSTAFASSPTTGAAMGARPRLTDGHDMDHYADDLAALTAHLDLKNAIHVGHSTGGGEVARYLGRHGESRVAKAALISAVPPDHGENRGQPGRPAERSVRRTAEGARRQSRAVLSRPALRTVLWFQPSGRQSFRGCHSELVAPGDDGRRQGAL